ncbi:hypothetical protein [Croceivirga thetidis]|uniref:Uncharacterized protein n=1 Tax=Croceivirga thetidis TaxID=2721623 RepID=A0ABX1GQF8_9FLAO|nr:hypothetical protein [Croceivirga thetidis]NKI31300.1 hypothetical protein [Croceivirga thetidis]
MGIKKDTSELRMVLIALLLSLGIISYALYDTYSDEVSEKITQTIAENLPEMDNDLAGR